MNDNISALDALKNLLQFVERFCDGEPIDFCAQEIVINDARAAIARAEGR